MSSNRLSTTMNIIGASEEMKPRERCIRMSHTGYIQLRGWGLKQVCFTPAAQSELDEMPKSVQDSWASAMKACLASFQKSQKPE